MKVIYFIFAFFFVFLHQVVTKAKLKKRAKNKKGVEETTTDENVETSEFMTRKEMMKILKEELNVRQNNNSYANGEKQFFTIYSGQNFWIRTEALKNFGYQEDESFEKYSNLLYNI